MTRASDTLREPIQRRANITRPAPVLGIEPPEWMLAGACAFVDPELWFPEKGGSLAAAKDVCSRCDVRDCRMTTSTDTELDQQTRDELQPPCETGRDENPATRIMYWHVECDHLSPVDLYCTPCADRALAVVNHATRSGGGLVCRECQATARLLRVEPLR